VRRALVFLAALTALLVGAAGAGAASGDLRVGSPQDFESPNPFKSVEAINVEAQATIMYDQLIGLKSSDESLDYGGTALAKGADVSADGKTITFHLKSGIHWSDGQPFTSADAAWTFNAVLDNKTNQFHGTIEAVKSVEAPDKDTFILHLSTPDSEFLDKLAIPILPKHIWSKYKIAQLDKTDGPIPTVTTAPYILTKWGKLGTTILTRNEKYDTSRNGGKLPDVKRILITYYANPDSIYRDVAQGNLDYGYGGLATWARRAKADKNPKVHLISSPRGGYWEIAFNSCPKTGSPICSGPGKGVKTAVVQDPAIRKAMAYAIDREKLIPTVYDGQGTTAYSLISPRFKRYFVDRKGTPLGYGYDPAKAKAALVAGGWDCAKTPCTKNGVKAEFELDTLTSSTQFQSMARRVKADALKAGIVVDLSFLSDDALNNKIYASGTKKDLYAPNYDAFLWDWDVSGTTPTPIMEVLLSNNASSDSFYDSKAFDTALIGARTAKTPEETVAAVRKAEAIALGDLPYLPLVHLNAVELNRTDTWHGWLPAPGSAGRPLFEVAQQIFALKPGPAPATATSGTPIAVAASTADDGWLTTPRSVLIGSILISLAIIASSFISNGRRRTEPLEWTEE
jgi:peptide/nickel transport system substrate-binding protein